MIIHNPNDLGAIPVAGTLMRSALSRTGRYRAPMTSARLAVIGEIERAARGRRRIAARVTAQNKGQAIAFADILRRQVGAGSVLAASRIPWEMRARMHPNVVALGDLDFSFKKLFKGIGKVVGKVAKVALPVVAGGAAGYGVFKLTKGIIGGGKGKPGGTGFFGTALAKAKAELAKKVKEQQAGISPAPELTVATPDIEPQVPIYATSTAGTQPSVSPAFYNQPTGYPADVYGAAAAPAAEGAMPPWLLPALIGGGVLLMSGVFGRRR